MYNFTYTNESEDDRMSYNFNLSDDLFAGTVIGFIWGIPKLIGISILALPFVIVSSITDVPVLTLVQNLFAFTIAIFLVWLFSKYQIIENGIVGLVIGFTVYINFTWHPVVCILIGLVAAGLLFLITAIKVGFWMKTISFSLIITLIVYAVIYSESGILPLPDMIWKITFFITFLLENLFIRCSIAFDDK